MWFRRDLRLADHPALAAAANHGPVVPVFVLDPRLARPAGAARLAFLFRCLRALDDSLAGALVVRHGSPADALAQLVQDTGADAVYATGGLRAVRACS